MRQLTTLATVLALVIALAITPAAAQRAKTTRQGLKPIEKYQPQAAQDTIDVTDKDVVISGFEKTLRSRNESFFITNHLPDTLTSVTVRIEYLDMHDRQLHQRTETRRCDIPPGQTRMLVIKSWDRQQVWYYHLSEPPRTRSQATPFKVAITPVYAICHGSRASRLDKGN